MYFSGIMQSNIKPATDVLHIKAKANANFQLTAITNALYIYIYIISSHLNDSGAPWFDHPQ